MHEGHRQRMLQRLEDAEHLQDHELLEILLFNAIPRKNTNPLAHELLAEFVSLDGLMRASYEELLNVQGIGKETAAYLRCIAILCERLKKREDPLPRLFNVRDFSGFLFERLAPLKEEVIELFALDAQQHIIAEKRFTDKEFFAFCGKRILLCLGTTGIFMAHYAFHFLKLPVRLMD